MVNDFKEQQLTILGFSLGRLKIGWGFWPVTGDYGSVDAGVNTQKVIKYRKYLLGTWHTHPPTCLAIPSDTDYNTFVSSALGYGQHLIFLIENDCCLVPYRVYLSKSDQYPMLQGIPTFVKRWNRLFIFWEN